MSDTKYFCHPDIVPHVKETIIELVELSSNSGLFIGPNLTKLDDKKCNEILNANVLEDKTRTLSLSKQTWDVYQTTRKSYNRFEREKYFFQNFLPGMNYVDISIRYNPSGSMIFYSDQKGDTKAVFISKPNEQAMVGFGSYLSSKLTTTDPLFIRIDSIESKAGHSSYMTVQKRENKISYGRETKVVNRLVYHMYDPHGNINNPLVVSADFILRCIALYDKKSKIVTKYNTNVYDNMSKLSTYNLGLQRYSQDEEGYCVMFTLFSMASTYMVYKKIKQFIPLNKISECVEYLLAKYYRPCQIMLLMVSFALVITQEGVWYSNKKKEETKKGYHQDSIDILDNFYNWLEYELKKKKPDFTRVIKYAQHTLRFTPEEINEALDVVKERILTKKKDRNRI